MADAAQTSPSSRPGLKERYEAAMVLGAVGDAMGYASLHTDYN